LDIPENPNEMDWPVFKPRSSAGVELFKVKELEHGKVFLVC
jgi:hypothetical protein